MTEETDYFLSQDGLKLRYRNWEDSEPKAMLCIIHGLGEHSKRYTALAHSLAKAGISVFAMDLRGHGKSQGRKGHTKNYQALLNDIEELLKVARSSHTELPMFLMGHSLGGNLVANYMIEMNTNELSGFILSSPWLRLVTTPPEWKTKLAKSLSKLLPFLSQPNGLNPEHLSRDPKEVSAYINDPLVHDRITLKLFLEMNKACIPAIEKSNQIKAKGLVYHGSEDQICSWEGSKEFAENCLKCEWKLINGAYHEPHNDHEKETIYQLIKDWIKLNS